MRPATENAMTKAQKDELESNNEHELENMEDIELDAKDYIRYGAEISTLLCVLSYVIFQQGDEIKNQGFSAYMKQLVS